MLSVELHHVIPDRTGSVVIVFWEDGSFWREPVLGWLVELSEHAPDSLYYPRPITYSPGEAENFCVEVHEGGRPTMWVFAEEKTLFDLDSAIAHGRELAAVSATKPRLPRLSDLTQQMRIQKES